VCWSTPIDALTRRPSRPSLRCRRTSGTFAAFPLAEAVLLPALYIPILIMLVAPIFRGVTFEFRFEAEERGRPHWDRSFHYGSLLATFARGIVPGIPVTSSGARSGARRAAIDAFGRRAALPARARTPTCPAA
jgi:hypothetical protein